jgi:hypothetical protein
MMNHDLHCPCELCGEARQAFQRYAAEHDPHAGCTSLETMCPECRKWYEDNVRWVAQATAQDWADYLNKALGNNTGTDDEPDTEI